MEQEDIFYGGKSHRPPDPIFLKAGNLGCQYEAGYLRYIKAGKVELVRMIYSAVRDHNWGTIKPRISNEQIIQKEDHFEINYDCQYQQDEIDFQAHYQIKGKTDGSISFEMQGEAMSTFRKNRIGFNILHPPETAGANCWVGHTKNQEEKGVFPKYISPHQPFIDIKSIRWEMDGIVAKLDFEGDIFEMEDQRNWTDASFKTYSTPLGLPFPVTIQKGEIIKQSVKFKLIEASHQEPEQERLTFSISKKRYALPDIGIGQSSEIKRLRDEDLKYLKAIRFSHYRVDLQLSHQDAEEQWERGVKESNQLELPLELALHFSNNVEDELEKLSLWVEASKPSIKQLLIFSVENKSTPEGLLQKTLAVLRQLLPEVQIGAGTDCFFTELNRERVPGKGLDFLTYSLNPQVHQFDNQSLVETLQAQLFTVESAKQFSHSLPLHISPLTIKMRFNPNATGPEKEVPFGKLPPQVDTRQMSLFGADWTLGSLKYLAESGLKSATYFETLGRRGIMQGQNEPLLPGKFKSEKEMIYPMYWVFYVLLQHEKIKVMHSQSSNPLIVDGMSWESNEERMMMLANFQPETLEVEIKGWKEEYECEMLDAQYFMMATPKTDVFLNTSWKKTGIKLKLSPYALCILK